MPLSDDPWLPYDSGGAVAPARAAVPIVVCRYAGGDLTPLPNVRCLHVERHEGTDPGRASFRYDLASGLEGAPASIEEAMSTEFAGDLVVNPGDRLVVRAQLPDGSWACLFDGFPMAFGMDLSPRAEGATFGAIGVAFRSWDNPISSAVYRSAATPATLTANVQTRRSAHFNPDGKANAVKQEHEVNSDTNPARAYPVFLDVVRDPPVTRPWTVPMAVRMLLYLNNDETFVLSPDAADIEALLTARIPKDGVPYDPTDPATYDAGSYLVADLPATGKDWPSTVAQLVGDLGFQTMFRLNTDGDGLPQTVYGIYRAQAGPLKDLYLGPRGTPFDPTLFNFDGASLDRDIADVANAIVVRGAPVRYEVSVVLAPAFPSTSSDGSQANLKSYDRDSPTYPTTDHDKYRVYVFDEAGDGHYAVASTTQVFTVPSLDAVFGAGKYAVMRRKPIGKLFSEDAKGQPLPARLAISTNYAGSRPGLWDGTGAWQDVAESGWSLLPDRLGIRITAKNPNGWKVGASTRALVPYPAGVVKGVESQCGASGAVPFHLRLTCVIEADECCQWNADRRDESPVPWRIVRLVDAKDRVKKEIIHKTSELNDSDPSFAARANIVTRDNTDAAKAEATAVQAGLQSGQVGGTVSIPRFTGYYGIGDRIASIEGRGLGLRTDGDASGLNLIYPVVTGVRWDLDGEQRTTLTLSDAGSDRRLRRTRANRGVRGDWRRRANTGG